MRGYIMFKKREYHPEEISTQTYQPTYTEEQEKKKANTILKGSKLVGDINVTYDLELSGEVEGNINSEKDSNIIIKGVCRGNIMTKEGNVDIEGELINGDIIAGGDVKITGKFNGGIVKARGKVSALGEFNGKIEANEIEIGPNARGKGELLYKEFISISRGAQIEASITQQQQTKDTKKTHDAKVVTIDRTQKEAGITK
jgi:cytoskeletal protein CcmA (bactofilin family)